MEGINPSQPESFKVLRSIYGEFDPGSERTLAACLTHASRARTGGDSLVQRQTGE